MNRQQVESSNIAEIGYDTQFATLEVLFKDGKVYQYFDVPSEVYNCLVNAASVGQYFNAQVRGIYRYARV